MFPTLRISAFRSLRWAYRNLATTPKSLPSKEAMLTLDWKMEGIVPKFFKANMGILFQQMTRSVKYEDKVFGYNFEDPVNLNMHVLRVRSYFRYKSPFNKMEYLGSYYYADDDVLTVLWRLQSLKSNFLRYFPKFITGKEKEYRTWEGALELYVNSDSQIYRIVNRPVTEDDKKAAEDFAEQKRKNNEAIERREKELSDRVAKRVVEESKGSQ